MKTLVETSLFNLFASYTNGVAKSTLEAACKAAKLLNVKSIGLFTKLEKLFSFFLSGWIDVFSYIKN